MWKHVVMWKFKEKAEKKSKADNLREARDLFLSLPSRIPAIRHMDVGIDIGRGRASYDLVLIVDVDNKQALSAYINHPAHQAVSDRITVWRESRVCVDMEG